MAKLDPRKYNLTPLMVAAAEGDLVAVNAILAGGADVNARDNRGATALMYAVQNGHRHVIRSLLQAGADPRLSTHSKLTAFEIARKSGFVDVLELLQAIALALEQRESSRREKPSGTNRLHTHYDNLKVSRDAPPEVIRAAYRSLSQKYHPDHNPSNPDAARIMAILNTAYEVLSDPVKRREHDRWIAEKTANAQFVVGGNAPARTTSREPNSKQPNTSGHSIPTSKTQFGRHLGNWWLAYALAIAFFWAAIDTERPEPARTIDGRNNTPHTQTYEATPNKSTGEAARALNEGTAKQDNVPSTQIAPDITKRIEPLPLPANGKRFMYVRAKRIAPLTVVTNGTTHHFFVKLEDWKTGKPIMGIFIRAGHTVETDVPLGSFRLKYATGMQWFGDAKKNLFGPETSIFQADKRFDFHQSGEGISGYTVQLFLQPHGNLHTENINRDNW